MKNEEVTKTYFSTKIPKLVELYDNLHKSGEGTMEEPNAGIDQYLDKMLLSRSRQGMSSQISRNKNLTQVPNHVRLSKKKTFELSANQFLKTERSDTGSP